MIRSKKEHLAVLESIKHYKNNIIKDINLGLKIIDEQDKIYKTMIDRWEEDEIVFEAPVSKCDWVIFALPSIVELCFITNQSIYMTKATIKHRQQLDGRLIYKAKITAPLEKKQQRAHFRLATLCPIHYRLVPDIEEDTSIPDTSFCTGTTVNISVGGLCIVTAEQFEPNQILQLRFHFLEHDFDMRGIVLEKGECNQNNDFIHRIRFVDTDNYKEDLLSKLIFEKQRLLMRSARVPLYKSKDA